jgi:tight adherence protein B
MTAVLAVVSVLLARPPAYSLGAWRGAEVRWRRPMRPAARRSVELEWIESLIAEIRAGRDPRTALLVASRAIDVAVAPRAVAAASSADDVALALEADGDVSPLIRAVSACWEVAQGSGAGLASSLTTLADSARETERVRRELHAGLAEPRATALVLAGLPGLGLMLGWLLGADPLAWLLGSPVGWAVLLAGLGFEALGALWAWRIAVSLEAEL